MRRRVVSTTELDPGNPFPLGWLGYAYGASGNRAKASEVLERLKQVAKVSYVQPYMYVLVYAGLGDRDRAIEWIEKSLEVRADELLFLRVDPAMDGLRSDPRFKAAIVRMRFPSTALAQG